VWLLVNIHHLAHLEAVNGYICRINEGKSWHGILTKQFSGIQQQAAMQIFHMEHMRVSVTNQVEMPGAGQCSGPPGIMFNRDAQWAGNQAGVGTMVMDRAAGLAASRSNEMLVTTVVAINKVNLAVKQIEIRQHEWRDEIATVKQQFSTFLISQRDRASEMGDMIVGVGADGDTHNDHCQNALMANYSVKMYSEQHN
jgi:hypothetical protein